jgi:hypothetical protein
MTGSFLGRGWGGGRQHHLSSRQSLSSIQEGSESSSSFVYGYLEYLTPDLSIVMCNGCMSGRVQNSTPYWSLNGKQLSYERGKLGTTTKQAWWQIVVSRSMSINDYHLVHYIWMMSQWVLYILSLCNRVVVLICGISRLCVMYIVKYLWFIMCRTIMCFVLLQITIMCMCRTIWLK